MTPVWKAMHSCLQRIVSKVEVGKELRKATNMMCALYVERKNLRNIPLFSEGGIAWTRVEYVVRNNKLL